MLFGGEGYGSQATRVGYLNDLWSLCVVPGTPGTYTGTSFTPYDFSNGGLDFSLHENLVVTVDILHGGATEQTIAITANCDTPAHAAAAITIGARR